MPTESTSRKRRALSNVGPNTCHNTSISPPNAKKPALEDSYYNKENHEHAISTNSKPKKIVVDDPYVHEKIPGYRTMTRVEPIIKNENWMQGNSNNSTETAESEHSIMTTVQTLFSTISVAKNPGFSNPTFAKHSARKLASSVPEHSLNKVSSRAVMPEKQVLPGSLKGKRQRKTETSCFEVHMKQQERDRILHQIDNLANEAEESRRLVYKYATHMHVPAVTSFMREVETQYGPIGERDIDSVVNANEGLSQKWHHLQKKGKDLQEKIQNRLKLLRTLESLQRELVDAERDVAELKKILTLVNLLTKITVSR